MLHLPGQLNAYFALPLEPSALSVTTYVEMLHQAILGTLADFDLHGSTRPDAPGVFLGPSRVASVGVAVKRWVAYHGFTLNVGTYLGPFGILDEPGHPDHRGGQNRAPEGLIVKGHVAAHHRDRQGPAGLRDAVDGLAELPQDLRTLG